MGDLLNMLGLAEKLHFRDRDLLWIEFNLVHQESSMTIHVTKLIIKMVMYSNICPLMQPHDTQENEWFILLQFIVCFSASTVIKS